MSTEFDQGRVIRERTIDWELQARRRRQFVQFFVAPASIAILIALVAGGVSGMLGMLIFAALFGLLIAAWIEFKWPLMPADQLQQVRAAIEPELPVAWTEPESFEARVEDGIGNVPLEERGQQQGDYLIERARIREGLRPGPGFRCRPCTASPLRPYGPRSGRSRRRAPRPPCRR